MYAGSLYASDQIEIGLDLVPTLLGEGVQLLDVLGIEPVKLERTRVVEAQGLTHLGFRLAK